MKDLIRSEVAASLARAAQKNNWPGDVAAVDFDVLTPPDEKMGDFSVNAAMVLAKILKKNPMEIAEAIRKELSQGTFSRTEVAPPGYINLFLSQKMLSLSLCGAYERPEAFGKNENGKGKRVLVEFVSSNPTGPIHLGNARGGPIGDTIANVLEMSGFSVDREFYLNDAGNQVDILGHSVLRDDESQYGGAYIEDLAKRKPPEATDARAAGKWAAGIIVKEMIVPSCEAMGIQYDRFFSESTLHKSGEVKKMLELLKEKKLVYEKDGALWYRSSEFGDDKDRVLVKKNGDTTYLLSDFAYHENKLARGYDKLVTVLGADHRAEGLAVKSFVENILGARGAAVVLFTQFVRVMRGGKEVKMSKRRGTFYAADDLVGEVGRDAFRFLSLLSAANSHIVFDIDAAIERSEKNPVYSVQYAHARMCSIIAKAREAGLSPSADHLELLTHPKERALILAAAKFGNLVCEVSENYEVHRLPRYAMELSDRLHSFYEHCRVIDEENRDRSLARLALVSTVKNALSETLRLCGVGAPKKM